MDIILESNYDRKEKNTWELLPDHLNPEGSTFFSLVQHMQKSDKTFSNADKLIPERMWDNSTEKVPMIL